MSSNRIAELAARAGIKIPELAKRIGMKPATLRVYTRGEREPRPALAEKIAEALDCTANEVMGFDMNGGPPPREAGNNQIPLYGNAAAGIGADVTNVSSPVEYIDRHPAMMSSAAGYAVFVIGTSMEPRFREGEIVYCRPGKPARRGDDVVVQIEDDTGRTAIVKEYVSADDAVITLRQHNPEKTITIPRDRVVSVHTVCGTTIV
jgi:phage repressor protein C with HTH and peptisase S24 domain